MARHQQRVISLQMIATTSLTNSNLVGEGLSSPTDNEVWIDIPGYENEYQVSNLGRVKSLERFVNVNKNGKVYKRLVKERILRPGRYTKCGHVSVVLRRGKPGIPVHQLVTLSFLGEVPEGMEVLHKNGNPKDNRLENLRYGTRTENILDVYYEGKAWRKLTIEDVLSIRFGLATNIAETELASMYGVSFNTINRIKHGRNYSWLK